MSNRLRRHRSGIPAKLASAAMATPCLAGLLWVVNNGGTVALADSSQAAARTSDAALLAGNGNGSTLPDDLNIGLYTSSGAITATAHPGQPLTIYVIATFSNATGLCGVMDLAGTFTASAPGGSYAAPSLTNPLTPNADFDNAESSVGVPSGVNGGWGIDSYTGFQANYVFYRSDAYDTPFTNGQPGDTLAPVTNTTTIGSVTGVLMGTIVYTAPASGSVNLNFALDNEPGIPAAIWVQNMGWSAVDTPTGGLVDVAPPDSGDAVGTVNLRGLTLNVPEPASLTLLALGAAGLLLRTRRRTRPQP